MPYLHDKSGKVKFKKIGDFWHPIKKDGSISKIKGSTQQKARNALQAYEAIKHSKK